MNGLKWKNVNRKRNASASYTSSDYVRGYDLDQDDFTALNTKKQNNISLTYSENNRYGDYILTIIEIVLEGTKFKNKTADEKYELRDQMYFELLQGILCFDANRGSKIYSYAYRIAYTAACHYYTNKIKAYNQEKELLAKCQQLYDSNKNTWNYQEVNVEKLTI